jgi:hypothetical protein
MESISSLSRRVTLKTSSLAAVMFVLVLVLPSLAFGQAENVAVGHPVYDFLKRMEVKGEIERYHDAVLPLSRKEIAEFLVHLKSRSPEFTNSERGYLEDFLSEFQFDIEGTMNGFHRLVESSEPSFGESVGQVFSDREKYLYAYADTNLSFFVNGILNGDVRRISGDALGKEHSEFFQFGGRIRGTIFGKLGYYLQGINAQFWGSRELLERDKFINQTTGIHTEDAKNFDMSEGYMRYDAEIVSAEVGTERLLWGTGHDQLMVVSDNVRPFPFIRMDAQYKSVKYTFIHGWLLGTTGQIVFSLPSDTSSYFVEPTNADKYIAAHRLEFSFPGLFDVGGQEMVIYSNRSVDLGYLTPLIVLESAQRARGERDNTLWAFDIQTHFLPGLELTGTLLMDDIHFGEFFENNYYNKNAYQLGLFLTSPLFIPNTDLRVQWTRVEPYTFGHDRSRDNSYSSLAMILGPDIGPNAEAWFIRTMVFPLRNLKVSLSVTLVRQGENIVDGSGQLIKNVGGDFLQPHRQVDPLERTFLDGILVKTQKVDFLATYEIRNQIWLDAWYQYESINSTSTDVSNINNTYGGRIRMEF